MSEILKLYNVVFTEDGQIKACGRENCKKLIVACEQDNINNPHIDFGNSDTGFMNVENIKNYIINRK